MDLFAQSWAQSQQASHGPEAYDILLRAYHEPHRAYHGRGHILDLLSKLDDMRALARRPDLIKTAIFWHDAIYRTREEDGAVRPDARNVADSRDLFLAHTRLSGLDAQAVEAMIMATANHTQAWTGAEFYDGFARDLDLFVDLDLSLLGAPWPQFEEGGRAVRYEFSWAPAPAYCAGRAAVLQKFLDLGENIYRRAETRALWGAQARENLARSIDLLKRGII
jgi:predicted metal-dependent HD superfamily phosphohydrolase